MTISEIKAQCEMMTKDARMPGIDRDFSPKAAAALKKALEALEHTRDIFPVDSGTAWAMRDTLHAIQEAFR